MSILQKHVIQSLDGLSDDNLQFLLDMILRFIKPDKIEEDHNDKLVIIKDNIHRIGSLEGQDLIDAASAPGAGKSGVLTDRAAAG